MEEVITIVIFLLLSFLLCINWDVVSSPGLLREVLVAWKSTRDGLLNRNDSAKCIGPSSSALKATGCPCSHDTAFPKFERYPSREVWTVHVLQLLADCTHRKGVCTPPLNLENSPCTLWCLHCGLNCNLYRKKSVARDICRASCACYFHGTQMMSIMWESLCSQSSAPVASGAWHTSKSGTWNSFLLEFSRFAWTDAQKFLALSVGLWCFTETKQGVCHTSFPVIDNEIRGVVVRSRTRLPCHERGVEGDQSLMCINMRIVWAVLTLRSGSVSRGVIKEQWCEASTNDRCWV